MNKRLRLISSTLKGQEITKACLVALNKYYDSMLINFSDKQQDNLLSLLRDLHSEVCNMDHNLDSNYIDYLAH